MSLSRGLSKVKNFLNLIEVPAILLLVWGAVSHFGLFPEFLLPSPEKVWSSFVELLVCGELWKHIAASAGRVFGGFFLHLRKEQSCYWRPFVLYLRSHLFRF